MQAGEAELLEWANARISERAAHLKTTRIVLGLPLTAIGKIFKPRLRLLEIESVVRQEAGDAGVATIKRDVVQDVRRGLLACYVANGDAPPLASRLGRHAFATDLRDLAG